MATALDKLFDLARKSGDGSVATPAEISAFLAEFKRTCLACGPEEINAHGEDGYTPAHVLARRSDLLPLFDPALKAGMDFNAECETGGRCRPIHSAAFRDRENDPAAVRIIDWLLQEARVDVNSEMDPGWRPLHLACCRTDVVRVEVLCRAGADLEAVLAPGKRDLTALLVAAARSSDGVVKALLLAGADPSKTSQGNKGRETAYQLALNNPLIRPGDVLTRLKTGRLASMTRSRMTRRRHLCAN